MASSPREKVDSADSAGPAPGRRRPIDWLEWTIAFAVALSTGVLWALSFPPFDFAEAAYFFATPYLGWVLFRQPSWKSSLWVGAGASFLAWVVILRWLRHFPEQTLESGAWFVGLLALAALAGVVALFGLAWFAAVRWVLPRVGMAPLGARLLAMLGLAGLWVVLEWLRGVVLTGFPWLVLAASQWERPLVLQVLSLTGSSGLSFTLILFNFGLVFYLRQFFATRRERWWRRFCPEFYLALIALFFVIGVGFSDQRISQPQRAFAAGFVQPAIEPRQRWDAASMEAVLEDYRYVAYSAKLNRAEVIFWPEASTPMPAPGNAEAVNWLEGLARELEIPILMGNLAALPTAERDWEYYNAIIQVTPEEGLSPVFYRKRHLVPFGEYVPRWLPFLDKVVPLEGEFTAGTKPTLLPLIVNGQEWQVGPLVCYEDVFPGLSRELVQAGATFLFVATNDAWYGREGAAQQHAAHSVLRAVETRRPVLRAGNMGWSGWIDERGHHRAVIRDHEGSIYSQMTGTREVFIDPLFRGQQTLYVRRGDWFVAVGLLLALATTFVAARSPVRPLVFSPEA
jgi:apolipoprotein N-acyltransferase